MKPSRIESESIIDLDDNQYLVPSEKVDDRFYLVNLDNEDCTFCFTSLLLYSFYLINVSLSSCDI